MSIGGYGFFALPECRFSQIGTFESSSTKNLRTLDLPNDTYAE